MQVGEEKIGETLDEDPLWLIWLLLTIHAHHFLLWTAPFYYNDTRNEFEDSSYFTVKVSQFSKSIIFAEIQMKK